MDYSIIYIATTPQQALRIEQTLTSMQLSFPVYLTFGQEAADIAKQMIDQYHTRVIVSRGGTIDFLRQRINIPIIDIRHGFIDIHLSVERALKISDRIAIVGYPRMCAEASRYLSIMGRTVDVITLTSNDMFDDAVMALKARGIELVIGGLQAIAAAQRHGMLYVPGDADQNSIEQATTEALNILRLENERLERYQTMQAILNHTIEGILQVDTDGEILHINNHARQLLGYFPGASISALFPDQRIFDTLRNGVIHANQLIELNDTPVIFNCIPIIVKAAPVGAVITLQREEDVLSLDHKIRRKNAERGYVAKKVFSDLVSRSSVMDCLKQKAMQYARSDKTIVIYGETGTGKEVLAQSIHNYSNRARNPFVAINCAALPESILESELFGYASGAFTGARREGHAGIFEMANSGTVFLDEISELSMNAQTRFLRVIQEKELSRIGANHVIPIDVRIIVASNKRLFDVMQSGAFRPDLYYRLCVLELELPPLRQRREDIAPLVQYFLSGQGSNHALSFSQEALDLLSEQRWSGNIRQLANIVERILVTSHDATITRHQVVDALGYELMRDAADHPKERSVRLEDAQLSVLREALEQAGGNRTKAAELLSISTATLWRKMKRFGLL